MRRRRSCLSVPGASERKLAKAPSCGADELVLDLEDAVAPDDKDAARALVGSALADPAAWHGVGVAIRVNAPRTPWCHRDVLALAELDELPVSIVVPKVQSRGDLEFVDRLLDGAEAASGRTTPLRVQALIETAAGLRRVGEIAGASPRLDALILGYADLGASLGRPAAGGDDLDLWLPAQDRVVTAARAHGIQAIDGPYLGIADDEPFRAAAERARRLGFDGKWAIHPQQVAAINTIFTPSGDEVAHAVRVIEALDASERDQAGGVVVVDGEMVDEAVRVAARQVLVRAGRAAG